MKKLHLIGALACAATLSTSALASAATTQVVTEASVLRAPENAPPTNPWMLYTRAGTPPTAAAFVEGPGTPPLGTGSFQTTTVTGAEKVQLFNYDHVGTKLSDVAKIAYSTYRTAGSADQLPALNVEIDFNGAAAGGFSTLVFEPVYNLGQGSVANATWQQWTATGSGVWWSTKAINGQCAGASYDCFKTWDQIIANNPDATVLGGVGINQGSGNPGLNAATDAFTFDQTTYDFEAKLPGPVTKDDCKNGGYAKYTTGTPPRPTYKNQGECVSAVAKGDKKD